MEWAFSCGRGTPVSGFQRDGRRRGVPKKKREYVFDL